MTKKKKITIIISCILPILLVLSGVLTYLSFNPHMTASIFCPVNIPGNYQENIAFSFKHIVPPPKNWYSNLENLGDMREEINQDLLNNYIAPINVKANFEMKDGKTIVTYSGTATKKDDGKLVDYNKELVVDYIFSHNIDVKTAPQE